MSKLNKHDLPVRLIGRRDEGLKERLLTKEISIRMQQAHFSITFAFETLTLQSTIMCLQEPVEQMRVISSDLLHDAGLHWILVDTYEHVANPQVTQLEGFLFPL